MGRSEKKTIQQLKAEIEQGLHPLQQADMQLRILHAEAAADSLCEFMEPSLPVILCDEPEAETG